LPTRPKSNVSRAHLALNPTNKGVMRIKRLCIRNVPHAAPKDTPQIAPTFMRARVNWNVG